ncbi:MULTISPECIES: hypothetical protein [Pseudomonas syringae group genomosp. 2]|uniref:Uncharacterized protein n=2 Tax=Pseudomonas amygdali pv. lachrymans TaxID=53707 RepID=A0ABR5KRD8_PSEAV|nr:MULTISPECIES: hypothetical protein [Pseudomonas syringae group genomosp. 2]AXH59796.1 hypothetical protein PLA107_031730 [Pseudomonas amygdali pv. lachrymans str. M301315]KPC17215.1 Uncharacterized protein AC499_0417 [Pseudomonas amygdali pv. lachrymans]KPC18174.1 Uncharacterized protein AC499_1376 [Pseudomonas amygdali pv. lachrymans]RMT06061.1 hypothetical protein ALP54_03688 [Pseudomonas amygdali pv. lachrymans]RMV33680.1 hypothetical protein ALP12_200153 [Pseudomonas savastanoi pv. phas
MTTEPSKTLGISSQIYDALIESKQSVTFYTMGIQPIKITGVIISKCGCEITLSQTGGRHMTIILEHSVMSLIIPNPILDRVQSPSS